MHIFCLLVFGCADIKVPQNAWYRREGNIATFGCAGQEDIWTLKCTNSEWNGVLRNCSENGMYIIQTNYVLLCISTRVTSNVLPIIY